MQVKVKERRCLTNFDPLCLKPPRHLLGDFLAVRSEVSTAAVGSANPQTPTPCRLSPSHQSKPRRRRPPTPHAAADAGGTVNPLNPDPRRGIRNSPLRPPEHEGRDEGGGDGAGRRLRELRRLPLLELPGDRFDSPAVPPPSDSLASSSHRLLLRRMSCSGSPTTPAPTRCSGPPRWTWTCCTAPARRTRWRRPPACVGGG